MTAEQAVQAAPALGAARAVPIHFGAFDVDPFYRSAARRAGAVRRRRGGRRARRSALCASGESLAL